MIPFEMAVPGTRATCLALLWSLESINDVWRGPYRRVTMLLSMSDEKSLRRFGWASHNVLTTCIRIR